MKRPSRTVVAIVGAFLAFVIVEVIVWWPDAPTKKTQEPPPAEQALAEPAPTFEQPPAAAPVPTAAARPGREIHKLEEDPETAEERELMSCFHKPCGAPCLLRCDPQDGRCTTKGFRPGQCTPEEECSYMLPAVCPQTGESPP